MPNSRLTPFLVLLSLSATAQIEPPTVTRQPRDVSKSVGDFARFSPLVGGGPATSFQWRHNGQPVLGGTNLSLLITNLAVTHSGLYTVTVGNEAGSVESQPARLDIDTTFVLVTDTPITKDTGWQMAWGDYNGDGQLDLLCSGNSSPLLYRNDGEGRFTKIGSTNRVVARSYAGGNGLAGWMDFDNDGRSDVFIVTGEGQQDERDYLFRNIDGERFEAVTNAMTQRLTASMSAAWGDVNRDGRLDIFLANTTASFTEKKSELWLAQSDGGFALAPTEVFPGLVKLNLGSTMFDHDADGDLDILVGVNPNSVPILYDNRGDGSFDAIVLSAGGSWISGPMVGDYDNDGLPDILMGFTRQAPMLFHNDGDGAFSVVTGQPLTDTRGSNWGSAWGDYDNDGWLDVFLPRAIYGDGAGGNDDALWRNNGDGTFTRIPAGSVGVDGMDSYGPAWGDYNNDGFLDLAVAGSSGVNRLYRNGTNANAWILIRLVGTTSNRDATGALIRLRAAIGADGDKRRTQYRQATATSAWSGQNDPRIHFGLADAQEADEIEIRWPSGKVTTLKNVPARQILTITEPDENVRLGARWTATGTGGRTPEITLTGPAGMDVAVERSTDLRTWTNAGRVTLDGNGNGVLPVDGGSPMPAFFRGRKP